MKNKTKFIGYGRQTINDDDIASVLDVLKSDLLTQGPVLEEFEKALAEYTGARFAIAVTSGTAALHLACLATGVKKGSRGVTSTMSFVASANCILYCNGTVDLLDIDQNTLNIEPQGIEKYFQSNDPDIIIPVHFGGLASDSEKIRKIAGKKIIIEDASHSLGGKYSNGKSVGSCCYSDLTVFSFHPVKSITTGEGGAILTNNPKLAKQLMVLRAHGIEKERDNLKVEISQLGENSPWLYDQRTLGFNYRMTELQAALGLNQLKRLDDFITKRREIASLYDKAFSNLPVELVQKEPNQRSRSALHLYQLYIDWKHLNITRSDFMMKLRDRHIGSQVHYKPIHLQSFYMDHRNQGPNKYQFSESHYDKCISLPIHPSMSYDDIERVINAVKDILDPKC